MGHVKRWDGITVELNEEEAHGKLRYCLLTDAVVVEGVFSLVYGACIVYESRERLVLEKVHDVTDDAEGMMALIQKMAAGQVFPMNLMDIIEDFVD